MNNIFQFLREAYAELIRVSWPSRSTTFQYTILVVLISLGVAAFLGALDYLFGLGIKEFLLPQAPSVTPPNLPDGVTDISPESVQEIEIAPTQEGENAEAVIEGVVPEAIINDPVVTEGESQ